MEPGVLVHYVMENGEHRPALVLKAWSDSALNLAVFVDGTNDVPNFSSAGPLWKTSVTYDESESNPNTWHYITRSYR